MKPDWRFMVTQKAILKQIGLLVVPDTDLVVPPFILGDPWQKVLNYWLKSFWTLLVELLLKSQS